MAGKARALETLGQRLRHWRARRELTQLALANATGISQRHISFLENGRSRVGGQTLAGLQSPSGGAGVSDPREVMAPAQLQAMHRLFAAHDPLPAVAVDRRWNVVASNEGARIFGALAAPEGNLVETFFDPAARERLANWSASAQALLARLRSDMRLAPDDRDLAELYQRFASHAPKLAEVDSRGIVVTLETSAGQVAFISLGASFTEPTLRPALRFELFYPADERSEQRFERWNRQAPEVR